MNDAETIRISAGDAAAMAWALDDYARGVREYAIKHRRMALDVHKYEREMLETRARTLDATATECEELAERVIPVAVRGGYRVPEVGV